MKRFRIALASCLALVCVLSVAPAIAAEGRTPIWQPTSITASGRYIVTRNISNPGGPAIEVLASNVDIDLNGMVVEAAPGAPVIHIVAASEVTIRNGVVLGGFEGVFADNARGTVLEDLRVIGGAGPGILLLLSTDFAVRHNVVADRNATAILADAAGGPAISGTIADNQIHRTGDGILVDSGSSVTIIRNRIEQMTASFGIAVGSSRAVLIKENTVEDVPDQSILVDSSTGCKLQNNLVAGAALGIHLAGGEGHLLLDNVARGANTDGILVDGNFNHLERNLATGNALSGVGYGIQINGTNNIYRGNSAFKNGPVGCAGFGTPELCDNGAANFTHGDNYAPFAL